MRRLRENAAELANIRPVGSDPCRRPCCLRPKDRFAISRPWRPAPREARRKTGNQVGPQAKKENGQTRTCGSPMNSTGPPSPENATPRLGSEAQRRIDDDIEFVAQPFRSVNSTTRRRRENRIFENRIFCERLKPTQASVLRTGTTQARLADRLAGQGPQPKPDGLDDLGF